MYNRQKCKTPAVRHSLFNFSTGAPMSNYELAQLNIGLIKGAMDSPIMADFAASLDRINALAERTPGFVWRLQTEEGDATSIRPFEDERMLVNMSVWRDVESPSDRTQLCQSGCASCRGHLSIGQWPARSPRYSTPTPAAAVPTALVAIHQPCELSSIALVPL
jgi:Domain of unknown function (DUF3291)